MQSNFANSTSRCITGQGDQPCVRKPLHGAQNSELGMRKGQPALEKCGIRRLERAVCAELDGGALYKSACRHDHFGIISGHIPWLRRDVAVNRRSRLNAAAEGDEPLRFSEIDCLNNIVSRCVCGGRYGKPERFKSLCRKNCALFCVCRNARRQKQPLIVGGQNAEGRPHFFSEPRRRDF